MFDLTNALTHWKSQLSTSGSVNNDDMNELEAHLLDEMDALQLKGLSSEESFLIATKRLGSNEGLSEEFGKVNVRAVWAHRLAWMFLGSVLVSFLTSLLRTINTGILAACSYTSISKAWMITLSIVVSLAYIAGVVLLGRKLVQGSALNQRISCLKRWGIFAVLLFPPTLLYMINSIIFIGTHKQLESNQYFFSAFQVTSTVLGLVRVTINIALIYFVARYFSKNKKSVVV